MVDYSDKTHYRNRVTGTISGFEFTTDPEDNITLPSSDHEYTLPDLYNQLRALRNILDPEKLQQLEELISSHLVNFRNPHKVSLALMGTSVLKELYNEWIAHGGIGTEDVFLKVIFQYVKIADLQTTLQGTALDEVPSVSSAYQLVKLHNEDINAHTSMFGHIFPGSEIKTIPTLSIHGFIGISPVLNIIRDGPLWYTNQFGLLQEAKNNELPADSSFGDQCFPIFGEHTNLLVQSEDFSNTAHWEINKAELKKSTSISDIRLQDNFAWFFCETQDDTPVAHKIRSIHPININANKPYTISLFVHPVQRTCFGINLGNNAVGQYSFVHFNLLTEEIFTNRTVSNTVLTGGVTALTSGWYRVWVTFTPSSDMEIHPEFYPLDIYDGDDTYVGNGLFGCCISCAEITQCAQIPPYIPSLGTQGALHATIISASLDDWYRKDTGTFVVDVSNMSMIVPEATKEIFSIGNGISSIALNVKFTTSNKQRGYFTSYNQSNSVIVSHWSVENNRDKATFIHSYSPTKQLLGYLGAEPYVVTTSFPINTDANQLYLGCDRYLSGHLDGYLYRFVYYPSICTEDNIHFFLEE